MARRPKRRRASVVKSGIDRGRLYLYGAMGGIVLAIVGVWLTPLSAAIGRREMDLLYGVGWVSLAAGSSLALLCVLLIVLES